MTRLHTWTPNTQLLAQTEKQWQQMIITTARCHRWDVHHHHDSRRSEAGWPDLVLIGHQRALFVELKTETGRVSAAQHHWLNALATAGCEVALWRPRHLPTALAALGPTQQRLTWPTPDPREET